MSGNIDEYDSAPASNNFHGANRWAYIKVKQMANFIICLSLIKDGTDQVMFYLLVHWTPFGEV